MILSKSYETSWIQEITSSIGKRGDPKLVEKIIFAFSLLEQLKLSGLDFVFKGGTSVFLTSDNPSRFSIDVDIIVSEPSEKIISHFDKIIKSGLFMRWIEDKDRKSNSKGPFGYFKFYYKSNVDTHFGDEPILLDILFASKSVYPKTNKVPVKHKWLNTSEPYELVSVPSCESILGDKLTAFAPNTTGILYSKNRPVEIIKQLFDISYLFDCAYDFAEVKSSFHNVVKEEINYRKLSITHEEVLRDALGTSLLITRRDIADENFVFLQKGINNIVNFIITPFKIENAIICSAKVAYITQLINQKKIPAIARFKSPNDIATLTITQKEFDKLNRLKKTLPEAFFYWYHALNLIK